MTLILTSTSFLVVTINILLTCAIPIPSEEFTFEDDWNFNTIPGGFPLLNVVKEHQLPTTWKREGKETFDSLQHLADDEKLMVGNAVGHLGDSVRSKISCSVCQLGVGLLQSAVQRNDSFIDIGKKFVNLCVGFDLQNSIVCKGIFEVFGPDLLPVLKISKIGPAHICRLILGETCENVPIPIHDWDVELPYVKKPEVLNLPLPQPGKPFLKVLQISDTHFDPDYEEGSISNCDEPLCCRSYSSPPKEQQVIVPAGKWGAYDNCDVPKVLIDNMLQNIARDHPDIDYIIWTGDLPPHDIWQQTKNGSLDILKQCVQQMKDAFPNIPILPALGNHEGIPAGSFPPPWNQKQDYSISWLYEEVNRQWKNWLPDSDDTVLHGGFYSTLVRPGFRVISLNMNYCHSLSWWLLVNSTDPAKELKWLIVQLQEAENNGEKVHIIGHIPPGVTDCLKTWSQNYYKIVNRYESVITAQFFGHTHGDEFEVFYDIENASRPINVAYIGPSVTPYSGQNPAYRIYYVDGNHEDSTWEVIDHETWIMDLDQANIENEQDPTWFQLYSAKASYQLPSLRPTEWNDLLYKMVHDKKLFNQFYKFYYRNSPASPQYTKKEKLQMLCDLKSSKSQDKLKVCRDLEEMMILTV